MYVCTIYAYECDVLKLYLVISIRETNGSWIDILYLLRRISFPSPSPLKKPHKKNDLEGGQIAVPFHFLINKHVQHSMKLSYRKFRNRERSFFFLASDQGTDLTAMRCHQGKPLGKGLVCFSFGKSGVFCCFFFFNLCKNSICTNQDKIIRSINLGAAG